MIVVPDSVAFYWSEPANMAATNLLIDRTGLPLDLELDEVEQFETASLAAQRVRLDFWRLLRQLWSGTWAVAVRSELPAARLLNYEQHVAFPTDPITPSLENAWTERSTFGLFAVRDVGRLVTRLMFRERGRREVGLSFYFQDAEDTWAISNALELGPGWSNEDGWRSIAIDVGSSDLEQSMDVATAAEAARAALAMLSRALA